jgi:RHS repeat-associated protein
MSPRLLSTGRTLPSVLRAARLFLLGFAIIQAAFAADLSSSTPAFGSGRSCDPTVQSCAPSSGAGGGSQTCGPAIGGAPCDGSGPASLGSGSGVNMGAGNPINVATGNKYQREVDLAPLPGVLGLEIVRHYNSTLSSPASVNGILGRGWRLSYDTELFVVGRSVQILQADGSRLLFSRDPANPSVCAGTDPAQGRVQIRRAPNGETFAWHWQDGRRLDFDARGRLVQITAPTGELVTLQRDPKGLLVKITDPQGRSLRLSYVDHADARAREQFRGVTAIDSPVGRFTYDYGSEPPPDTKVDARQLRANLVKVVLPTHHAPGQPVHAYTERGVSSSSVARNYHYEDPRHPTLLTGISIIGSGSDGRLMHERIGTWAYDEEGRAVLSVRGSPRHADDPASGIEQVSLEYSAGTTVLTNSLGQRTTYTRGLVAGEHRLLEVRGAGCASCGPVNVRYGYDTLGRLDATTTLTPDGKPLATLRTARDPFGRPLRVTRSNWHDGRPGPTQLLVRYEYPADLLTPLAAPAAHPTLIARPSVVTGREHRIAIRYNAHGQPLALTESGFSPATEPHSAPTPIQRTATYRYQTINGRSLLAEIDGPLANGPTGTPQDSDITRAEWDPRGNHIIEWTEPGGFRSAVTHDPASGQLAQVRNAEGKSTGFTHDARSQLTAVRRAGPGWSRPHITRYRYDALGYLTEAGEDGDGDVPYRPQLRQGFDVTGRLQWSTSPLGILLQNKYDSESRLVESGRYSNSMALVRRYSFDALGRIIHASDNSGAERSFAYGPDGHPQTITHLAGQVRSSGRIDDIPQPGTTPAPHARRLRDDFGRTVAIISPDSGTTLNAFDAADRLTASTDALGNTATYEHDAAGRIVRQTITDRATGEQSLTTWTYQGKRLVALDHPTQRERYTHDERGLLIARAIELRPTDNRKFTSITRYTHDDAGRLTTTRLPDGSVVIYERNGQDQVVALKRSVIQTSWLRWLLPPEPIVQDLQRDIVGLKGYTAGNGVEARYQRSREGRLARVLYRAPRGKSGATTIARLGSHSLAMFGLGSAHAATSPSSANGATTPGRHQLPGAFGAPADPDALIDHRYLWDTYGNLLLTQGRTSRSPVDSSYAYDRHSRLIAAVQVRNAVPSASRFFYDAAGRRVLSQQGVTDQRDLHTNTRNAIFQDGTHRLLGDGHADARYDAAGQPARIGSRDYVWDALGRLREVREDARPLARYTYNHRGERIGKSVENQSTAYLYDNGQIAAELDAGGRITRQYLYLSDQPLAVIDTPEGKTVSSDEPSTLEEILQDLGTAFGAWLGEGERIVWLHANHLGAIEVATDGDGKVVWQAHYAPFGQASVRATGFTLNLRLPGQYEDPETGLHYNRHRYYNPATGRYLTPDPLGTPDGPNPYTYVRDNPLRYVDPSGLILFAFDGTNNSNPPPGVDDFSNVYKFFLAYDTTPDSPNGTHAWYMNGIGRDDPDSGIRSNGLDQYDANTGRARVDYMLEQLDGYIRNKDVSDGRMISLDIVGFSRGAALARDFSNRVASRLRDRIWGDKTPCVEIRFMGLWDTVAQFGPNGASNGAWQLAIPPEARNVYHAVAINENRYLFPGESIGQGTQRGFIGSHADIGGSYGTGDLSDVALNWIVDQAKMAGLSMHEWGKNGTDRDWGVVTNPVVHDKSNGTEDSAFCLRVNNEIWADECTSRRTASPGGLTATQALDLGFIANRSTPGMDADGESRITGDVNMEEYAKWLKENYHLIITVGPW